MSNAIRLGYIEFPPSRSSRIILRPVARIGFEHNGNVMPGFFCLIDSGADYTTSFKEIGFNFGINFENLNLEPVSGIGGRIRCSNPNCDGIIEKIKCPRCKKNFDPDLFAYRTKLNALINGYKGSVTLDVLWLNKKFNPDTDFPFVIGRKGFFETFDIEFKEREKAFYLKWG